MLNLSPDPDAYLPDKRARRVVRPLYMSRREIPKWHDGTLSKAPKLKFVPPAPAAPAPAKPPEQPQIPLCPEATRRWPAPKYLVYWRDESGDSGREPRALLTSADRLARQYDRPQCWAVVIDAIDCVFLQEYGIRFAELVAQRLKASQDVSLRRKGPARAGGKRARRAAA